MLAWAEYSPPVPGRAPHRPPDGLGRPDPLPIADLLTAVGLTIIYRLDPDDARRQIVWVAIGLACRGHLVWLRWDYRVLERYKYVFGVTAVALLLLPSLPGLGHEDRRPALGEIGPLQFQPGELAKILLIVFLAAYLRDKGEVLAQGRLRTQAAARDLGAAMLVLVQTSDLGSALLTFGIFLGDALRGDGPRALRRRRAGAVHRRGSGSSTTLSTACSNACSSGCTPGRTSGCTAVSGGLDFRQNCDSTSS